MKKSFYISSLFVGCYMLFSIAASANVPVVTANPAPDTACSGNIAKFFVSVTDTTTGATSIVYAWQVSSDGGATWSYITDVAPYSHSATDTLYVTASSLLNRYQYRSIDTNNDGADTSSAAMLTVDTLNAGTITGASSICVGSSTALTDAISGGMWSNANTAADTISPVGIVTGRAAGFDTVMYAITNACGTARAFHNLRVDATAIAMPITGPTATCVGHSIDLMNANVLGTGIWSVSNTSASILPDGTLTGVSGGFDTVTYSFTNACNSVDSSIVIRIDAVLTPGSITGPSSVCIGSWISLSATVSGGFWLSSSSNAIVDGSGNVTGVSGGAAIISYVRSNACGESVATHAVTVDDLASGISGGDSVGVGAMLTLSNSVPGGTWTVAYPGGDTIATISTGGVVTGVRAGTTTITYSVTNSCGTSSATMTLYVGHAPSAGSIIGLDTVCLGTTITLSDTSFPGGVWFSSVDSIATVNSSTGVVTGNAGGYVVIFYAIHDAFGSDTISTVVFVNQAPVAQIVSAPVYFSLGQNYFILGYPCCGSFTQSNDSVGAFINFGEYGATKVFYTPTDSVTYSSVAFGSYVVTGHGNTDVITYTVSNSCGSNSADSTYHLPKPAYTPVVNAENRSLNVYPNPNQGQFILYLNSGTSEQAPVTITNVVGEKVKELTIPTNTSVNIKLDQPAGIYFISAQTASSKYTTKITIAE